MNRANTYVYLLRSESYPDQTYIGFTCNLRRRPERHNEGTNIATRRFRPWRIQTAIAFSDRQKAIRFEKYLKSHSGRTFASKHF